jgi:SRSO17 transposase
MTAEQIEALSPALDDYLKQFLFSCGYTQTFNLMGVYCRGLLTDLPRKTCEPLALFAGIAVRTLQEFLKDHLWSFSDARDTLQRHVAAQLLDCPDDGLGTLGIVDETGVRKKGTCTPGVQRQWCGEVGKQENCVVTVHLGVARGRYKTLVDADLFLPLVWDQDRPRCQAAGIPDEVVYRPKWLIALGQIDRALANGIILDGLTFDEEYGKVPDFLTGCDERHLRYVGEVPKSFHCFTRPPRPDQAGHRADDLVRHSPAFTQQPWRRFRLHHQTEGDSLWEAKAARVWVSGCGEGTYWLIWARNVKTGEEKYFVSNAPPSASLGRLLRVGFSRWNVEHCLRTSKGKVGFRDFQGRNYVALMRHLTLCMMMLTFAAGQAERLRGEKSGVDAGADVRGAEAPVRGLAGGAAGDESATVHGGCHRLSPAA